jgi:hypothetical protein
MTCDFYSPKNLDCEKKESLLRDFEMAQCNIYSHNLVVPKSKGVLILLHNIHVFTLSKINYAENN